MSVPGHLAGKEPHSEIGTGMAQEINNSRNSQLKEEHTTLQMHHITSNTDCNFQEEKKYFHYNEANKS